MAYAEQMIRIAAPLALLCLAACADPHTECVDAASTDLRVVQSLIADTQATLQRGYAIQTETRNVLYTDFCIGTGIRNGGFRFCNRSQPVTSKKPVAVDLDEERRKLRALKRKEAQLKTRTTRDLRRCELTHPRS